MNIALWIVQGLLAALFLYVGGMKLMRPRLELAGQAPYVEDFSDAQIKGIGALEVVGAVGLILPWALNILPILTPLAALGLALTMVGAAVTHNRRGEPQMIGMNVVVLLLSLFVVYGRFFLS